MDAAMFLRVWGSELRRVRKAAGLSQVELSGLLGTTQKQVSRVENGANTTLATLYAWYTACRSAPPEPEKARD